MEAYLAGQTELWKLMVLDFSNWMMSLAASVSAHGPILNFFNNFLLKIKVQRGHILWEKLTSHVFRALCNRPFWLNTCQPNGQIWGKFFRLFEFKIQKNCGSVLCKNCYSQK